MWSVGLARILKTVVMEAAKQLLCLGYFADKSKNLNAHYVLMVALLFRVPPVPIQQVPTLMH